jgi:hypothetical protein
MYSEWRDFMYPNTQSKMSYVHKAVLGAIVMAAGLQTALAVNNCGGTDCVRHEITIVQDVCTEVANNPATRNARWMNSLSLQVDDQMLGGNIIAYKLRWSDGSWSAWIVPGVNDIDTKFNVSSEVRNGVPIQANSMRRLWSYFYDHTYSYIICKKQ